MKPRNMRPAIPSYPMICLLSHPLFVFCLLQYCCVAVDAGCRTLILSTQPSHNWPKGAFAGEHPLTIFPSSSRCTRGSITFRYPSKRDTRCWTCVPPSKSGRLPNSNWQTNPSLIIRKKNADPMQRQSGQTFPKGASLGKEAGKVESFSPNHSVFPFTVQEWPFGSGFQLQGPLAHLADHAACSSRARSTFLQSCPAC